MPVGGTAKQLLVIPGNPKTVPEFQTAIQIVLLREIGVQSEETAVELAELGVVQAPAEEISAIAIWTISVEIP